MHVDKLLSFSTQFKSLAQQVQTFPAGTSVGFPNSTHTFVKNDIITFLQSLEDGTIVLCRGRDPVPGNTHGEWDYGLGTKTGDRIYINYVSQDSESLKITTINSDLIQLAERKSPGDQVRPAMSSTAGAGSSSSWQDKKGVMIISHGWSPQVGPNYPLIHELQQLGKQHDWHVIVPNFKTQINSYTTNHQRSRAERVKVIYEELLCMRLTDKTPIILVGHSQGGAASATACTEKLCACLNICGLLMLGSEDPTYLDNMNWVPKCVKNVKIVHATGDGVIGIEPLRNCARRWSCMFVELTSDDKYGSKDKWNDDVNHDFLSKDLMRKVKNEFISFIRNC